MLWVIPTRMVRGLPIFHVCQHVGAAWSKAVKQRQRIAQSGSHGTLFDRVAH